MMVVVARHQRVIRRTGPTRQSGPTSERVFDRAQKYELVWFVRMAVDRVRGPVMASLMDQTDLAPLKSARACVFRNLKDR